ncbi:MAG: monovalent cation:proton antiporter-2 (CPA2) family protein [Gammaproteobacteria bacterium]
MSDHAILMDVLILLATAVVAVPLSQRLGLGTVLGYLFGGMVIGPWGLGLIDDVEEIRHLGEFGVVFLLFAIGIELRPTRLWGIRHSVFGLGSAQVVVTGLVLAAAEFALGLPLSIALMVGFGLALSSTAFGLQLLTERSELNTTYGRTSLGILLFQDLAVVPLLALVPLLSEKPLQLSQNIGTALLEGVLILVGVVVLGRYLLSHLFRLVARSRSSEAFAAVALLVVLGTAALMEYAGLSMAMGAFIAGVMLAESEYRHQVIADIQPFRGFLLGLFFMTVGMSIDLGLLRTETGSVLLSVLGLMSIKALLILTICRLSGLHLANAGAVALLLSQSGEFGFILFGVASVAGVLSGDLFQFLTLLVAVSMALTPLLARLITHVLRRWSHNQVDHDILDTPLSELSDHVIIAGFGRVGRRVARILERAELPYVAIDMDSDRVNEARSQGYSVFFGDASRKEVLEAAGAEQARLLVVSLDNPSSAERCVEGMHRHYPNLPIHARARDSSQALKLRELGATLAVSETWEASLQLGGGVLQSAGLAAEEINALLDEFRHGVYGTTDDTESETTSKVSSPPGR